MLKLRKYFISTLVFITALVLLFNEWIWDHLKPILEFFSRFRIIHRLECWISGVHPYVALSLFLVPFVSTHIIEIWALGLVTIGNVFSGVIIYGSAKVGGFVVMTRIFTLTKPKLMTVAWFAGLYNWFITKKTWLYDKLDHMGVWKKIKDIKLIISSKVSEIKFKVQSKRRSIFIRAFARVKAKISG